MQRFAIQSNNDMAELQKNMNRTVRLMNIISKSAPEEPV